MVRSRTALSFALALLALVLSAPTVGAEPAPFTLVSPANGAYLDTAYPTLTWNTTTSPAGIAAYSVFVNGALEAMVDPASCAATCSIVLPDPIYNTNNRWQVVAIDEDDEETETTEQSFVVDRHLPEISWDSGARVSTSTCAVPSFIEIGDETPTTVTYAVDGVVVPSLCGLAGGTHVLRVTATDRVGHTASRVGTIVVDTTVPVVRIDGPLRVEIGASASYRATVDPGTAVGDVTYRWSQSSYQWGFPTGTTVPMSFTWLRWGGTTSVRVTAIDAEGDVGTAAVNVFVARKPPPGPVGVTINGGARFTNKPRVKVALVWPDGTLRMVVSSSSGGQSLPLAVVKDLRDTIKVTGRVNVPSVVRVQFTGPGIDATYEDTITLDVQRPVLSSATLTGRRLRLRAVDSISGLGAVQIARTSRKAASATLPFRPTLKVSRAKWVRVRDRAGNLSAWRRVSRR